MWMKKVFRNIENKDDHSCENGGVKSIVVFKIPEIANILIERLI